MPRHPDPVTVGVPIGAHLLRRLDTVASDLGLGRPEAIVALASDLGLGRPTRPSCAGLSRKRAKPPSATACAVQEQS